MIRDWSNFIAGRTALVTGSGGGVGRAIAIQMARAGAELRVNDIHLDRAEKVCREIEEEGGVAQPVVADVCDGDLVARMVEETGPVDILVNNAGIPAEGITIKSFVETGPAEWDPLIRLNLAAVLGVTRAYLPFMLEQRWGRILTIVSDAGRRGERKQAVYGAAKAAAMGFSRGLAAEVGRDGVTVNCISLGTMRHGLLAEAIANDPSIEHRLAKAYPAGRIGEVDDSAPLAVLLCSDAASWITGQVYPVDGGYAPRSEQPRSERAVELPTGYIVRHPAPRDSAPIAEVVVAGDIADFGEPDFTEDDLIDDWGRPRFALDDDAWVLSGPTGRIVGYAFVWEAQPGTEVEGDAFVLPEYAGRGLGTLLLELMENRTRELATGGTVTLGIYASQVNTGKRELLGRRGFEPVRTVLRFKIELENRSPDPVDPPEGIVLRQYVMEDADAVRDTMSEAFEGHRRYTPRRLDEWLDLRLRHPAFDPALWRVAECDGEVVGATLVYDVGDTGYLSNVGVRRAWRGRGVAQALVANAFAALRERGQMRVLVSVDADAAPAAIHLYEELGMRVHERHDWFVKTLSGP